MRIATITALSVVLAALTSEVLTQTPAPSTPAAPKFEVVSIKRNTSGALSSNVANLPDGGLMATNVGLGTLLARAYPPAIPAEMIGLPEWTRNERYDVTATSSLSQPTPDQRTAMLRSMLVEHFRLIVHVETSEQPVYDLVLARSDARLGPAIAPTEIDCAAERAARAAGDAGPQPTAREVLEGNAPAPRCALRIVGDRLDRDRAVAQGDATMAELASMLRTFTGRTVVDKTGLTGFYRLTMTFDRMSGRRGPDTAQPSGAAPSIFNALQEQAGLKLESSRADVGRLVIDRAERPSGD